MNAAIPEGAWLAPMAGVTDASFRELCAENGAAMCVTEMISAKGMLLSPNAVAVNHLLRTYPGECVGAQLFGREPEYMVQAAQALEALGRYAFLDINMGCPAPKIVRGGEGAALLLEPELAFQIMRAVVRSVKLPVTLKMRLGWDDQQHVYLDYARHAQDAGIAAVTLHARTCLQQYSGHADWHAIALLKKAVDIPVIANGDIVDGESALACFQETGCDRWMIGRAALGNPWIFAQVDAAMKGQVYQPVGASERLDTAFRHAKMLASHKEERQAILEMRKHVAWYIKGIRDGAQARDRMNRALTLEEVEAILGELKMQIQ